MRADDQTIARLAQELDSAREIVDTVSGESDGIF